MFAPHFGRWALLAGCALTALGCGSDANCGTERSPNVLVITNIEPAIGSTVPNSAIVQTFTISGQFLQIEPSFALAPAHTAGLSTPNPIHWTVTPSGNDTVYTSEPIIWANAPGHVELDPPGELNTSDGCVLTLPSPTFGYDVTAP